MERLIEVCDRRQEEGNATLMMMNYRDDVRKLLAIVKLQREVLDHIYKLDVTNFHKLVAECNAKTDQVAGGE